jgi:pyrroline-5-carboxylate reductase
LIRGCNAVILAIKPNISDAVLDDIGASAVGKIILSIVTGLTTDALLRELPGAAVARIMPNTPALVGEGVIAFSRAHTLDEKTFAWASDLFSSLGRVYLVGENDMEAVTGVSGSGPAYAFIMIEAMADAGVRMGLPRALAYELAAQTLVGAGRMVLESERNPAALKDSVCSPGGTTIEAVYALEKGGFRAAVMDAVSVCALKAKALRDAQ